ncbi:hypothetical protein VULLAG_LOCUS4379 [Vulpes lagopus]
MGKCVSSAYLARWRQCRPRFLAAALITAAGSSLLNTPTTRVLGCQGRYTVIRFTDTPKLPFYHILPGDDRNYETMT